MESLILDATTGELLGKTEDPEMVEHVKSFPEDYIVWERRALRRQ